MYEHLRNDFLRAAHDAKLPQEALATAVRLLDEVACRYEIHGREVALTIYNGDVPEIVKIFIVCKKIEGLSQRTLDTLTCARCACSSGR